MKQFSLKLKFLSFLFLSLCFLTKSANSNIRDAVLYNKELDKLEEKCIYHLFNIVSNAISSGLLINGSRTGLGDKSSVMKKLKAQGIYYQGLNIMSLIDQEFMRQLYHEKNGCLPQELGLLTGSFDHTFIKKLKPSTRPLVGKIQTVLKLIFPDFPALEIKGTDIKKWQSSLDDLWAGEAYKELRKSIIHKLNDIRELTLGPTQFDLKRKFKALYHAFVPFSFWNFLSLPKENIKSGKLVNSIILPPFHQLIAPVKEDPKTWSLKKGLNMVELPKIINISVAKLTHIAYLPKYSKDVNQLIQVNLTKNFEKANEVKSGIFFGRLSPDKDRVKVSTSFPEDALIIRLNFNLQVKKDDFTPIKKMKERINEIGSRFNVDARIHKLGLILKRKAKGETASGTFEEAILKPYFSLKDSKISFRIHRETSSLKELNWLTKAGFICLDDSLKVKKCYRDYYTWSKFLEDMEVGHFSSYSDSRFFKYTEKILAKASGAFMRFVINTNIAKIEDAIDIELFEVLEQYAETFAKARKTITKRLNKDLFNP